MALKDKKKSEAPIETPPAPAAAPEPTAAPAPPRAARVTRWRVTKGGTIAHGGGLTKLPVGAEIDESGYGERGILSIREQGIELEPIG